MDYEIVQKHEIQDIYRLSYGVLLIINKYKELETKDNRIMRFDNSDIKENKTKIEKIKGIKDAYKVKENIHTSYYSYFIPKYSILFDGSVIQTIDDKKEFFYELKTTGNRFSGNLEEFTGLLDLAKQILNTY